jgi:hypothetical protein
MKNVCAARRLTPGPVLRVVRDTLRQIIPYERPKLAAIEVAGDQVNPMRVKPHLTKLTDEELSQLEKIVLKVGTGASGGHDGNADQAPAWSLCNIARSEGVEVSSFC